MAMRKRQVICMLNQPMPGATVTLYIRTKDRKQMNEEIHDPGQAEEMIPMPTPGWYISKKAVKVDPPANKEHKLSPRVKVVFGGGTFYVDGASTIYDPTPDE